MKKSTPEQLNISAIICAAGRGERAGLEKNKVLAVMPNGKTVLQNAISAFENCARVSEIVITAIALFSGAITENANIVLVVICVALMLIVNAGYGGGFSNLPTLLSDVYGMGKISSIHGIALSAWAFAGLTGNQIAGVIINATGSYSNVLIFTLILYVIAIAVDFILVKTPNKTEEVTSLAK